MEDSVFERPVGDGSNVVGLTGCAGYASVITIGSKRVRQKRTRPLEQAGANHTVCRQSSADAIGCGRQRHRCLAAVGLRLEVGGHVVRTFSQSTPRLVMLMPEFINPFESDGPELAAPARLILNHQPVILPSGAMREFYETVTTCLVPPATYLTHHELGVRPGFDCGCQPLGPWDIAECSKCLAVTCLLRHSGTCVLCGRVHCSACLTHAELPNGYTCIICKDCEKDMKTPPAIKLLKKLIWG